MSNTNDFAIFDEITKDNIDRVREMLDANPSLLHLRNKMGDTPLSYAIDTSSSLLVETLITFGANVEEPGRYGTRPLARAVIQEATETILVLIKHGVNINAWDEDARTALIAAAAAGSAEMVTLLLENGADPTWKDPRGFVAATYAEEKNHLAVAMLLKQWSRSETT